MTEPGNAAARKAGIETQDPRPPDRLPALFASAIFVSALLLFQVQPMSAKILLPWFGGSANVWTTCMLFFQAALLLGYVYAHLLVSKVPARAQRTVHCALLAASLLALRVLPKEGWKPHGGDEPMTGILLLLLGTVGVPYFLLSTTGPLLQAWYGGGSRAGDESPPGEKGPLPYRLYALSNLGSALGLLTYPLALEPLLALRSQALLWMSGYVLFVLLSAAAALVSLRGEKREAGGAEGPRSARDDREAAHPGWAMYGYWTLLAACSCTLLLAVTNHLSQNVAAIPFLWLLPLGLYLLSFIICFGVDRWEWKKAFLPLPVVALVAMAYLLYSEFDHLSVRIVIPAFAVSLFICCVLCHGELARLKPHPRYLTSFYLTVALGGALGGVFTGLIAPRVFCDYVELPVALGVIAVVAALSLYREKSEPLWEPTWLVLASLLLGLVVFIARDTRKTITDFRVTVRNFYGVLRVREDDDEESGCRTRRLTHGTIRHGDQFLDEKRRHEPTTYYGPKSGAGLAISRCGRRGSVRVGVVGLGTGTLAAYGRKGDYYRFYEINPLVEQIARKEFTYLSDSKAGVDVVLGDARLTLESEPDMRYDVLAIDAFSSDSIPVHLLTREAFQLYFRHLGTRGVLAVHISNRYLDLQPVVQRLADDLGKEARLVNSADDARKGVSSAEWVLVTASKGFFTDPSIYLESMKLEHRDGLKPWTDDFSNLYQIIK